MSFEIRIGPRGAAAFWNGRQLTSAYDAEREACRWAEGLGAAPGSLIFVAGDPLGLACRALAQTGVQAVALLPGTAARSPDSGITAWAPEDGGLEAFLQSVLDQWGPDAVSWQVWPAFERYAGEIALDWSRRFRDVYRAAQGSWLTQSRFGQRFWTNAVRNTLDWERAAALVPGTRPIVIAASGPSLEDTLPVLAQHRNRFELWALPSSFEVLTQRGFTIDAAVATDGGYYAGEHLRRLAGTDVPLLAALSSAPDASPRPRLYFSQGLEIERVLLGALMPGFGEVPSQGTVAVTAIELALAATSGPVLVAGLDLSFRDLRAHAGPHTADRRLFAAQTRLSPYEGLLAENLFAQAPLAVEGARTAPALLTYSRWFRTRARFARPVYRIAPSALRWNSMTEVTPAEAVALMAATGRPVGWRSPPQWPTAPQRRRAVTQALEALLRRIESESDGWIEDAARTGAPGALAEDWRSKRAGLRPESARPALADFVLGLRGR